MAIPFVKKLLGGFGADMSQPTTGGVVDPEWGNPYSILPSQTPEQSPTQPTWKAALNNALLAAAFTPESNTAGGAISAVGRGLIGAKQYEAQQQLEQAMRPYQIAQAQLGLEKTEEGLGLTQAQADAARAHALYWQGHQYPTTKMAAIPGVPGYEMGPGGVARRITDANGNPVPTTPQSHYNLGMLLSGQLDGPILAASGIDASKMTGPQRHQAAMNIVEQYNARSAGLRMGATQAAQAPYRQHTEWINSQIQNGYNDLPRVPSQPPIIDPVTAAIKGPQWVAQMKAAYNQAVQAHKQRSADIANWQKSGSAAEGIPLQTYIQRLHPKPISPHSTPAPAPDLSINGLGNALDKAFPKKH